ncbi:MAG: enoyl-CoA hydratase/isomerase family protein, partial [Psychrobacter sp.]
LLVSLIPSLTYDFCKRSNVHAFTGLNEALDMEVEQQTMMAKTDDFTEGVTAFIEKRKPVYQGK